MGFSNLRCVILVCGVLICSSLRVDYTTVPANPDYPQPMICADCRIDSAHPTCRRATQCQGDTPVCMTSFYKVGWLNITQVKRCASVSECSDLWWSKTRLAPDCMGRADPYSWPGDRNGECHYCCHTDQANRLKWCNMAEWPTKPKSLLNVPDYIEKMTTPTPTSRRLETTEQVKSTTETTISEAGPPVPSTVRCEVCRDDPIQGTSCSAGRIEVCPDEKPFCMNSLDFKIDAGVVTTLVSKRCVNSASCLSSNINNQMCYGDLNDPTNVVSGSRCNFCCADTSGSPLPCNRIARPGNILSFLPKTHYEGKSMRLSDVLIGSAAKAPKTRHAPTTSPPAL